MLKAYRYKLEPNQSQRYALARTLDVGRELYNLCLHQRKLHPLSRYEQSKQLTQLKAEFPVYKNVYSQVLPSDHLLLARSALQAPMSLLNRAAALSYSTQAARKRRALPCHSPNCPT